MSEVSPLFGSHAFTGTVRHYSRSAYRKAIVDRIAFLRKFSEIIAIYQAGEIREPGISDIDLVIVLADDPYSVNPNFDPNAYRIATLSESEQYLFLHDPFVIPIALMPQVHSLFPFGKLLPLYGRRYAAAPRRDRSVSLALFLDGYFTMLRALYEMRAAPIVDRRTALAFCKSFLYSIALCAEYCQKPLMRDPTVREFQRRLLRLRASYFRQPQHQSDAELRVLLSALFDFLPLIADALATVPFPLPQNSVVKCSFKLFARFLAPARYIAEYRRIRQLPLPPRYVAFPVPAVLAGYFRAHGLITNRCGKAARRIFGEYLVQRSAFDLAMVERAKLLTRYTDFTIRHCLTPCTLFGFEVIWNPSMMNGAAWYKRLIDVMLTGVLHVVLPFRFRSV